ncbi:hypothetical protein H4582DRAFT_1969233, partial [Lactarius indigo]
DKNHLAFGLNALDWIFIACFIYSLFFRLIGMVFICLVSPGLVFLPLLLFALPPKISEYKPLPNLPCCRI